MDEQLKTSLNESIAFPVKYKPPPQFLEIKQAEINAEQNVKVILEMSEIRNRGASFKTMRNLELGENLLSPTKFSQMHNAFHVYKLKG